MVWASVPICGQCWWDQFPDREPVTIKTDEPQICYRCLGLTKAGIYVRRDIGETK